MALSFNGGGSGSSGSNVITVTRSGGGITVPKDGDEKPNPEPSPAPPPAPPEPIRVCGTVRSLVGDLATVQVETKNGGTKSVKWRAADPNFSGVGARICATITGKERDLPTGFVEQPAGLC